LEKKMISKGSIIECLTSDLGKWARWNGVRMEEAGFFIPGSLHRVHDVLYFGGRKVYRVKVLDPRLIYWWDWHPGGPLKYLAFEENECRLVV
jgi:hypothetical protein